MVRSFRLFLGLLWAALSGPAFAAPSAVVELFTSQGCASCRSADDYLADLAKRDDLLVLSYHVDYWDYLGWRDTLATPQSAARQHAYAEALGIRRIFTPQLLVNGTHNLVGDDRGKVESALAGSNFTVPIRLHRKEGVVTVEVGARLVPGSRPTTIRLVAFTSVATVKIAHGENAGATVRYTNVARTARSIGMWNGTAVRITLPENEVIAEGADGCAVFVQEKLAKGPGAILGAAALSPETP